MAGVEVATAIVRLGPTDPILVEAERAPVTEGYIEIIDAGNLSEAARRLKMTRANVSYHLNQFEKSIGLPPRLPVTMTSPT